MWHLKNDCYLIMAYKQTPESRIVVMALLDPQDFLTPNPILLSNSVGSIIVLEDLSEIVRFFRRG
jgi:hypothetical protein